MSVCNTEHLALLVLFTSSLLTNHAVCLRGECLSLSLRALSASRSILQAVCQPGASHLDSAVHEYSSHRSPLLLLSAHILKVNTERMTPNVRKHCPFFWISSRWVFLACALQKLIRSISISSRSPVKISKCPSNKMILHLIDIKSCFEKMYRELSSLFVCDWWIVFLVSPSESLRHNAQKI